MSGKTIVSITLSNYLIDRSGTPKVVMSHQRMANHAGVHYLSLFPVGCSFVLSSLLSSKGFGVIFDGEFLGIFSIIDLKKMFYKLDSSGNGISLVQIHHLLRHNIDSIKQVLLCFSNVPIHVYVHDYYLCCASYNLLTQDGSFCGGKGLNPTACVDCAYYQKSLLTERAIWNILYELIDRVTFIFPSDTVKRLFLNFHSDQQARCKVIPHQTFIGHYHGNLTKLSNNALIKVAYLGSQNKSKGWDVWCDLVKSYKGRYDFIVFNNQSSPNIDGIRRVHVEYSPKNPDAMIHALRKESVDIAFLWSQCPETYSYTCMEAYASNAFIVTCSQSGNIADFVENNHAGKVLSSVHELRALFDSTFKLTCLINSYRESSEGGPKYLVDNDKALFLSSMSSQNILTIKSNTAGERIVDALLKPLRILYAIREKGKIVAANE